jgi:guanylate cyclase
MLVALARVRDRLLRIGAQPAERPDVRTRRVALILIALAITVLATAWTATYLVLDRPLSAAVPFAYQVISVIGLVALATTRDLRLLRVTQIGAMLVLPFLLQWSLGGFINSSAMMVWAFVAPLAALVLYSPRQAVVVLAAYVVLTLVSGVLDPSVAASVAPFPNELRLLFFVLNIGFVSIVVYAALQYFVAARERAQTETDELLHNILPVAIADRLKGGESRIADDFGAVTVLFADVAGFTPLARAAGAANTVALLDRVFSAWDELADRFGLEKIKTIGDAYMAVCGAPVARPDHVRAAADMALAMLPETARVASEMGRPLEVRIGMHTGAAMAGVIGKRKFFYDVWGDAVNVASRMETFGRPGRIHVSGAVEAVLRGQYRFEERGTMEIKGLGEMHTFFLLGRAE